MMPSHRTATGSRPTAITRGAALVLLVASVASSGASCPQVLRGYQVGTMPLPRTLPAQPSLDQIIAVVHDNTQRVSEVERLVARIGGHLPELSRISARGIGGNR